VSEVILAAVPLSCNDLHDLANYIEAVLRQLHSKPSSEGKAFLKSLELLVNYGLGAATVHNDVDQYGATLQSFFISHPDKRQLKFLKLFARSAAELINESTYQIKVKPLAGLSSEFTKIALQVREVMVNQLCAEASSLQRLFMPIVS